MRCKAPLTLTGPGHLYRQRDDDEILGLVCLAFFELPDEAKGAVVSTSSLPLKCHSPGNSLVFQWSRLGLSLLWTCVQSLVGELKIPHDMQTKKRKTRHTTKITVVKSHYISVLLLLLSHFSRVRLCATP